nr:hypothetical protein [Bryobacterales bacterium]
MAKRPEITRSSLLAHFEKLPHARATYKQLVKELNAKGDLRDTLDEKLNQLVERGDLIEWK